MTKKFIISAAPEDLRVDQGLIPEVINNVAP